MVFMQVVVVVLLMAQELLLLADFQVQVVADKVLDTNQRLQILILHNKVLLALHIQVAVVVVATMLVQVAQVAQVLL
jgi:hypothetical protein